MASQRYQQRVEALLASADIRIGGDRPWGVRVLNEDMYARVVDEGMLGVGETYMDGWRECEQLDEIICRVFRADFSIGRFDRSNTCCSCCRRGS